MKTKANSAGIYDLVPPKRGRVFQSSLFNRQFHSTLVTWPALNPLSDCTGDYVSRSGSRGFCLAYPVGVRAAGGASNTSNRRHHSPCTASGARSSAARAGARYCRPDGQAGFTATAENRNRRADARAFPGAEPELHVC